MTTKKKPVLGRNLSSMLSRGQRVRTRALLNGCHPHCQLRSPDAVSASDWSGHSPTAVFQVVW